MSAGNSAYSPLPQSNSDSDCSSEEELHVSQGNRVVNRTAKVQNSKGEKVFNEQKNSINYNLLDNDGDVGAALTKFQTGPDEVSILKPDGGLEIFSTSRKICFVFSLLLCVFTTVAFLWILPCNIEPCLSASDMINFTWERNLPNLEVYGPISLVTDHNGEENLVFLTRTSLDSEKNLFENDLTCLQGKDGSIIWNLKLNESPTDSDCKLIDVNSDGTNDCLIFGRNYLKAVDPVSGLELWDIQKSNSKKRLNFMDFPLVISDLNSDGIKDFILPCSFSNDDKPNHLEVDIQNYLVIISGKTGQIINRPHKIELCSSIHNLTFVNSSLLSYDCFHFNMEESSQKIIFSSLYKSLMIPIEEKINLNKMVVLEQHTEHPNAVGVNGFRLLLENHGDCPENCDFVVDIRDENSKNKTIHHFKRKNSFGMAPVVLKTEKEFGFILKYWRWESKMKNSSLQNRTKFSPEKKAMKTMKKFVKRSKKMHHLLNSSKILDRAMLLESEWESQRRKRTAVKLHRFGKSTLKPGALNLHQITEHIIKLSINQSKVFTGDLLKDEIFQICNSQVCKPNVFNLKDSVLVSPLRENGKEKLITFSSMYLQENMETSKSSDSWRLQSKIRILNL